MLAIGYSRYLGWERSRSKRILLSSADFKVFVVGIHHDRMHVSDVQFPENYFRWVEEGDVPEGNFPMIRRTKSYGLSKPDSRIEACKTILAKIRYLNREWWKSREKCGFLGRNALEWKVCPIHNRFSKALCSCIVTIYFMSCVLICCISMHLSKSFLWLLSARGHFQALIISRRTYHTEFLPLSDCEVGYPGRHDWLSRPILALGRSAHAAHSKSASIAARHKSDISSLTVTIFSSRSG